jgi:hypothetical protein
MSQEQNYDFIRWWNEQSFPGRELFKIDDAGTIILCSNNNIKERTIVNISQENADVVVKALTEKFTEVDEKVREMEVEWLAAEDKQKLAEKVAQLKEYLHHVIALGDFEKYALLVHDWEHTLYQLSEENYAAKLKLAGLAEELADSEQWKEATLAFKDIADKWKQSGHIDKNRNDKLWNRIEAARKKFQERKRLHYADEEKDMLLNLDLKIDLVEQAETIAKSEDWKATTDAFLRLTEEWKTIGHTINKKNEELWQRFIAAKSAFFDKKREHHNKIQQEQEANYAVKLTLAEKAEALTDSSEWSATAQAYAALMEEWKKTGRVPHRKSDELWKRFTTAQEHFFETRRKHTEEIRGEQESNYERKKVIYERAERLKHSNHWGEATGEMNELLEEWKKTGPIPRSYGDKMWEDFNAARRFFFARKDANREQRKQYAESQKAARVEHAKNIVVKLENDIKEEEEKLADFKNAIENITPGKKAAELRAHLETLISDCTAKLKRLQDKFAQVQEDLKVPEPKPEPSSEA